MSRSKVKVTRYEKLAMYSYHPPTATERPFLMHDVICSERARCKITSYSRRDHSVAKGMMDVHRRSTGRPACGLWLENIFVLVSCHLHVVLCTSRIRSWRRHRLFTLVSRRRRDEHDIFFQVRFVYPVKCIFFATGYATGYGLLVAFVAC